MNERFQRTMERLAHAAGTWQHFAAWIVALLLWIAAGPFLHWSDTWQLLANTPTTWYELFLGLALLVDGALTLTLLLRQHERIEEILRRLEEREVRIERREEDIETALGITSAPE